MTKRESKKATTILIILAAGFCIINFILYGKVWQNNDLLMTTFGLIFLFSLLSMISSSMIMKASQKEDKSIVRVYMGTTVLRFFCYLAALIILIMTFKEIANALLINFFALYLVYTAIEKFYILNSVRKK